MTTPEWEALRAFRHHVYPLFGCRRDALFEALDAVLSAPTLETPAHLSLAPHCHRGWGSLYDALNAGTMDVIRLEQLVASCRLDPQTTWCAVDASVWGEAGRAVTPKPAQSGATTTIHDHHPYRHSHGQPIVAGWTSSWLVQVPLRCSRWTAPLRVRRSMPGENRNVVAAEQIRSWLGQAGPPANVPICTFDAGYDAVHLSVAFADLPVDLLVRLRAGRCFSADPTAPPHTGRPRRHGVQFVCADPTTWPAPTAAWTVSDPAYGPICLQAWSGLHAAPHNHAMRGTRQPRPRIRGTLIRLAVERLPRPTTLPQPLWFWWSGPTPPDGAEVWQAYSARFAIEHTFRFFKQTLRWTTPTRALTERC
jgi:hypothetical protein